jgi:hypothetical protein
MLWSGFSVSGANRSTSVPVKYNGTQKMLSQLCHIIQKTDPLNAEKINDIT